MAGVVSLPHHPQRSHLEPGFVRRHPVVGAVVPTATFFAGLIVYFAVAFVWSAQNIGNGISGLVTAIQQGGNEASNAASFTTSEGLTYGQLTHTELQARYPRTHWLSANTVSTPSHGGDLNVSVSVSWDHIVTAVAEAGGSCAWGLAVQSSSDPIITSNGLSGPGVYYTFTAAETTTNPPCEASSAPTSVWIGLDGLNKSG
jgi:hypothetical protein